MQLDKSPMTPEDSRERIVRKATECDTAILISFVATIDDDGKPSLIPAINYHNVNLATLLMSHDVLHRGFSGRLEYVMLDYVRMLRDTGVLAKGESNEESLADPVDGAGPAATTGTGSSHS